MRTRRDDGGERRREGDDVEEASQGGNGPAAGGRRGLEPARGAVATPGSDPLADPPELRLCE